ncbi:hypothetical protein [Neolewinella agarilytica]|uniref:hypothetical protein n=1 Tax=Neolewinella agarilytica TaxID=478744 RepID=UPI0023542190|nr:hypothetical protein [Neolewinella agarilytica]
MGSSFLRVFLLNGHRQLRAMEVKAFLSAHPQETIIMRYKDEYDDTEKSTFSAAWEARKTTYSSTFCLGTNWPTLGQARGKVVLLDFCGKASGGIPYHTNYLMTPPGDWHHTGNNHNERLKGNWRDRKGAFGVVALDFPSQKLVRQLLKFNEHPALLK